MKYKVLAHSLTGTGSNVYRYGDVVEDKNFPPGRAKQLEKDGHLEKIGKDDSDKPNAKDSIELINAMETIDEVNAFLEGEERTTVIAAADDKIEELEAE